MFLIKNATVYAPQKLGVRDVLVAAGRIVAIDEGLVATLPGLEVVDAKGLLLTPGWIDQHIHITGGGGEGGPKSRVPEVQFSQLVACGSTTVVGVSGTDSVTRPMTALLAKARALQAEGISAWIYTSNYALPPALLTDSIRNDLFMVPEVVGIKIAHSDHRSSFPTQQEMLRILSDIRVGGMIAGKPGVLHIHLGVLPGAFEAFNELVAQGIPIKHIRPTHCARSESLFKDGLAFTRAGGVMDITSGGSCFATPAKAIEMAIAEKAVMENITMSTDGNGSVPRFDAQGNMVGLGTGSAAANLDTIRTLVNQDNMPLETVLPMVTRNVAHHLALAGKGEVAIGMDADLCLFAPDMVLKHVMAKGRFLMRDGDVLVKGTFEE